MTIFVLLDKKSYAYSLRQFTFSCKFCSTIKFYKFSAEVCSALRSGAEKKYCKRGVVAAIFERKALENKIYLANIYKSFYISINSYFVQEKIPGGPMFSISKDILRLERALSQLPYSSDLGEGLWPLLCLARSNLHSLAEQAQHLEEAAGCVPGGGADKGGNGENGGSPGSLSRINSACHAAQGWPEVNCERLQ